RHRAGRGDGGQPVQGVLDVAGERAGGRVEVARGGGDAAGVGEAQGEGAGARAEGDDVLDFGVGRLVEQQRALVDLGQAGVGVDGLQVEGAGADLGDAEAAGVVADRAVDDQRAGRADAVGQRRDRRVRRAADDGGTQLRHVGAGQAAAEGDVV